MKVSWFKSMIYVALLFGSLTVASCKDNKDADVDAMETPDNTNDMNMDTEADTTAVNPDTIMGP